MTLEELKLSFIVEFEHYLRTIDKIGHNTSMKYAKDLKQILKYGVMLEYIPSNPFENFQCTYKKVKREFLDQEELDLLYNKEFAIKRLEEVRDCYVFSCCTGYAYSDAEALGLDDVAVGIDGGKWIIRDRKKTDTTENVPLLPIPLEIIEKYKRHDYCRIFQKLLPMNSNQRYKCLPEGDCRSMWNQEKADYSHCPTYLRNDRLADKRRSHGNSNGASWPH